MYWKQLTLISNNLVLEILILKIINSIEIRVGKFKNHNVVK